MRCSICMSTYDKPDLLRNTLRSIFNQPILNSGEVEVIVTDDRSPNSRNQEVCNEFSTRYIRIDGEPGFHNPAKARNVAYRAAQGRIVICQSDDVIHSADVIERLTGELHPEEFLIATVWNVDGEMLPVGLRGYGPRAERVKLLTGRENCRPLFFLGSLWRSDLYAAGGNDEEFTESGRDDVWFADCLTRGLGLTPRYVDVLGYHQDHPRPNNTGEMCQHSAEIYRRKVADAQETSRWVASGGPWSYMRGAQLVH